MPRRPNQKEISKIKNTYKLKLVRNKVEYQKLELRQKKQKDDLESAYHELQAKFIEDEKNIISSIDSYEAEYIELQNNIKTQTNILQSLSKKKAIGRRVMEHKNLVWLSTYKNKKKQVKKWEQEIKEVKETIRTSTAIYQRWWEEKSQEIMEQIRLSQEKVTKIQKSIDNLDQEIAVNQDVIRTNKVRKLLADQIARQNSKLAERRILVEKLQEAKSAVQIQENELNNNSERQAHLDELDKLRIIISSLEYKIQSVNFKTQIATAQSQEYYREFQRELKQDKDKLSDLNIRYKQIYQIIGNQRNIFVSAQSNHIKTLTKENNKIKQLEEEMVQSKLKFQEEQEQIKLELEEKIKLLS